MCEREWSHSSAVYLLHFLTSSYVSSVKVSSLILAEGSHLLLFQVELAEICTKSERYIGTEGGGMDQAISFLAEEGTVCGSF